MLSAIITFLVSNVLTPIKTKLLNGSFLMIITPMLIVTIIVGMRIIKNLETEKAIAEKNYTASKLQTSYWKTQYGDKIARGYQEELTVKQVLSSKDKEINALVNKAKSLNIKIRRLEYMLGIQSDTIIDTVSVPVIIRINDTIYKEIDSLTIGKLEIKRVKISNDTIATWKVHYNPTIYAYLYWEKEGKWKPINVIKPRQKLYFADIVTDDKLINVKSVKLIKLR